MTTAGYSLTTYLNVAKQQLAKQNITGSLAAALSGQDEYPTSAQIKNSIAQAHMAAGRFAGALLPLQQAEALEPGNIETWMLLAECHDRRDTWYEAERYYRKVLASDPDNITAIVNLEPILRDQGRYTEIRPMLNRVRELLPKIDLAVQTSLSMLDLSEGRLERGFQGYEHRFAFSHLQEAYGKCFAPRWTGESLNGKSVLMRFEQGLGDTVQYARYAANLKALGASNVTVLCKSLLHRLIATVPSVDALLAPIEPETSYDFEVMMMSMPAILHTKTDADIPANPYLFVSPEDAARWTSRLAPFQGKPKVGLVWSGELKRGIWQAERMNLRRSIPLELLRPLLDADCGFFSLQKGERQNDLKNFFSPHPIIDFMDDCIDFYDTACLIANLDLVIAVDTSTAHVAAALGKPVWMLSRLDGDWRWMHKRTDSPWYPSMTIYRQETFADWRPVICRLTGDLIRWCSKPAKSKPRKAKTKPPKHIRSDHSAATTELSLVG